MKRLTLAIVALAAMIFVACKEGAKKEGPVAEVTEAVENLVEKMNKANTVQEVEDVSKEVEETFEKLDMKYPDFEPTPEEEKELAGLFEKAQKASMDAAQRFMNDASEKIGDALKE